MEEVNELRLQIACKKTFSAIDHQGNTLNTNIVEVQAPNVVFWLLDDIKLDVLFFWTALPTYRNTDFI